MKHIHGKIKIRIVFGIYNLLQKILILGFKVLYPKINLKKNNVIISKATGADWLIDRKYLEIFETVKNLTLLDHPRLYTLYYFSKQFSQIKGDILDIGCLKGGAGITMSKINLTGKVFLIDTFCGYLDKDEKYDSSIFNYSDVSELKNFIKKNNLKNTFVFKDNFPENANKLNVKKIKIAHIDVNLVKPTKKIFQYVDSKVIKGGVIIFDDYGVFGVEKLTNYLKSLIFSKKINKKYTYIKNYFGQLILIKN